MSLTNMQYDEIIRSYNRRQLQSKREQNRRIADVYQRIPRIKEINEEISGLSLETTKQLLLNPSHALIPDYKSAMVKLHNEKESLLQEYGFPVDYMNIRYSCPDCQDTGYQENKKCHCFKLAEIDILYNQSNIKNILEYENFSNFSYELFRDDYTDSVTGMTPAVNIHKVAEICHRFIDDFTRTEKKYSNLLFFGETGVGKTFLTNCIAKELIERYQSVIYLSAIKLFNILSDAEFEHNNIDAKNQVTQILNCDLLIIDDLGTELSNSFTNSALFNCLNERLITKHSTIISTNLIFTELMDRYSERITSRLAKEFTFLKIYGDDLRHNKKVKACHIN